MKFTSRGDKADSVIRSYVDMAVEEIRKAIPDVKAVVIYGGYGRGEGSVIASNNRVKPANDFDTYVITESKVDSELLDEIARRTAKRWGTNGIPFNFFDKTWNFDDNFYLDLKCLTLGELKKLFPMVRYYELRNASNVVYGDPKVLELIPDYKIEDIPLSEGARLILNRMTHVVEYLSTYGRHNDLTLSFFCAKAYWDCACALLLLNGKYSPSYRKRMEDFYKCYKEDFQELAERLPDFHEKVKKYILWKLDSFNGLPEKNAVNFWYQTRNDILEVAKYFFSKFLNKRINNIDDLSKAILNMGSKYYEPYGEYYVKYNYGLDSRGLVKVLSRLLPWRFKSLYFLRIFKNKSLYPRMFLSKQGPDLVIFASMPYVMFALDYGFNINKEYFDKAKKLLSKVYPVNIKNYLWEDLSQCYADAYVLFYLMKIV